jgi:SAM-dependent methyltransferase
MAKGLIDIASHHETDKGLSGYLEAYATHFEPIRDRPVKLLELGIFRGHSLLLWQEYFPAGLIAGLDIDPVSLPGPGSRIRMYQGSQADCPLLDRVRLECAPEGFDVIIDDASHVGSLTKVSFWHLFRRHLKPGGLYVIEDWGTGYWESWADGARYRGSVAEPGSDAGAPGVGKPAEAGLPEFHSHAFGMVGFVKELVDECGVGDITHPRFGIPPARSSSIAHITIRPGQVFVRKTGSLD